MGRKIEITEELRAIFAQAMVAGKLPMAVWNEEFDEIEEIPGIDCNIDVLAALPSPRYDETTTPDTTSLPWSGTHPINIRVEARVIRAFKTQAAKTGTSYQTLMNSALRAAADGFV